MKAVPFDHRITLLAGKNRNFRLARNLLTAAISAKLPLMERALNRFPHDFPASEVCAQVRTACIQHSEFSARRAERHQIASRNFLRQWPKSQIIRVAKKIPRRWMRRETGCGWSGGHFTVPVLFVTISARVHESSGVLLRPVWAASRN